MDMHTVKDSAGQDLTHNDYIAYSIRVGNSSRIKLGQVICIYPEDRSIKIHAWSCSGEPSRDVKIYAYHTFKLDHKPHTIK